MRRAAGGGRRSRVARTWMYGLALAALDREELDRELFYCAALVHDFGISRRVEGRDFTLAQRGPGPRPAPRRRRPGRRRRRHGGRHLRTTGTPSVTVERDGALGATWRWGAMLDGDGLRASGRVRGERRAILDAHPRGTSFKRRVPQG